MLTLLLACAGPVDDTASDTAVPAARLEDLPVGECGSAVHDFVPVDQMGAIVAWEEDPSLSLSADAIDMVLASQGITALSPVPYGARVFRVRYTTQDRGALVEASAFVALPDSDEPLDAPAMAWLHGTTGFTDVCAPTAGGLDAAGFPLLFASLGVAVVAPDYLGMNGYGDPAGFLHPYLVPEATAFASLDAVRALRTFTAANVPTITPDPARTLLWGGSEGGFAALQADRYAAAYAPELHVVATLAPVAPTDARGLAAWGATHAGPTTLALGAALVAMHEWYGDDTALTDVLAPGVAAALPGEMASGCSYPSAESADSVDDIFSTAFIDAASAGDWDAVDPYGCYLEAATLNASAVPGIPDTPTLIVLGEADDLVEADVVRPDIPVLCAQGYRIAEMECAGAGHTEAAGQSMLTQWAWAQARLAGEPLTDACVIHDPTVCALE
jgi:hypothetical protein